jgi:DNA-binding FadR family transcriptional regulator
MVSMSESALKQLTQAIRAGDFKIGEKLPSERILARQFRVSRVAIREAEIRLQERRILQGPLGSLTVASIHTDIAVRKPKSALKWMKQLLKARRLLWVELARTAAKRATDVELEQLRGDATTLDSGLLLNVRHHEIAERYKAFVDALCRSSHNAALTRLERENLDQLAQCDGFIEKFSLANNQDRRFQRIAEALSSRNSKTAAQTLRAALTELDERLLRLMASGPESILDLFDAQLDQLEREEAAAARPHPLSSARASN